MNLLFKLFYTFAKIGLFTFGGGYAMLPMFQKELIERTGWITDEDLMDYYAIGQCTPGVIAVNTATFSGYKVKGFWGAIFATLGVIFPSLVIITIIAAFIKNFSDLAVVQNAFAGIRVCVCVLILNTILRLGKRALKDWFSIAVLIIIFCLATLTDISKIFLVIAAAVMGLLFCALRKGGAK